MTYLWIGTASHPKPSRNSDAAVTFRFSEHKPTDGLDTDTLSSVQGPNMTRKFLWPIRHGAEDGEIPGSIELCVRPAKTAIRRLIGIEHSVRTL